MSLEAAQRASDVADYLLGLATAARDRWEETGELEDVRAAIDYATAAERLIRDAGLEVKT